MRVKVLTAGRKHELVAWDLGRLIVCWFGARVERLFAFPDDQAQVRKVLLEQEVAEVVADVARVVDDFRVWGILPLQRGTIFRPAVVAEFCDELTQRRPIGVTVAAVRIQPQFILFVVQGALIVSPLPGRIIQITLPFETLIYGGQRPLVGWVRRKTRGVLLGEGPPPVWEELLSARERAGDGAGSVVVPLTGNAEWMCAARAMVVSIAPQMASLVTSAGAEATE